MVQGMWINFGHRTSVHTLVVLGRARLKAGAVWSGHVRVVVIVVGDLSLIPDSSSDWGWGGLMEGCLCRYRRWRGGGLTSPPLHDWPITWQAWCAAWVSVNLFMLSSSEFYWVTMTIRREFLNSCKPLQYQWPESFMSVPDCLDSARLFWVVRNEFVSFVQNKRIILHDLAGSKDPLTVKFADGGNKKKQQSRPWIDRQEVRFDNRHELLRKELRTKKIFKQTKYPSTHMLKERTKAETRECRKIPLFHTFHKTQIFLFIFCRTWVYSLIILLQTGKKALLLDLFLVLSTNCDHSPSELSARPWSTTTQVISETGPAVKANSLPCLWKSVLYPWLVSWNLWPWSKRNP